MDPVSKLIATYKIPVGPWGKAFIDFIVTYFQWFFDALSAVLEWGVEGTTYVLLQVPPVILAIALAGLAYWLQRSKVLASVVLIGLLFIINQALWKETVQTLVLVVFATALSMLIGVPLGIWAAHKPRVWRVTQPVLDLMQTMPTFVYLIPILILFGLGAAPALIVTVILQETPRGSLESTAISVRFINRSSSGSLSLRSVYCRRHRSCAGSRSAAARSMASASRCGSGCRPDCRRSI